MKKQQKYVKNSIINNKIIKNKSQKIWKIVSIAVVIVFMLVLAGGLIKVFYFKSSFVKPTQGQIDDATRIAIKKLQSTGVNASAFQIHVGSKIRKIYNDGVSNTILQVSFANNSTSHTYLIDVNSGEVLLHSETEEYGMWSNHKKFDSDDSMHMHMKYKR